LLEHVAIEAVLQIGNLVAADACADHLDAEVLVLFVQGVLDESHVALGADPTRRDRIAEEYDPLAFGQLDLSLAGRCAGGRGEQGRDSAEYCHSFHNESPWLFASCAQSR
jgi:hypothetical protein